MKISIDTSSLYSPFIGVIFGIISIIIFLFSYKATGIIVFLIAVSLIFQRYTYIVPKRAVQVSEQVEKTLKSLGLNYQKTPFGFSTKTTHIKVHNNLFFTNLEFKFNKEYTIQGKYLVATIIKYQRYI